MFKVENLQFFFQNRVSQKLRVMATNGLWIRVQDDILYKNRPVDIAEQKKSFILLDCVISLFGNKLLRNKKLGIKSYIFKRNNDQCLSNVGSFMPLAVKI